MLLTNPDEFLATLAIARQRHWPVDFATRYYGMDFHPDAPGRRDYEFWRRQRKDNGPLQEDIIDRWGLELFLQSRHLVPVKWMAAQLGMTLESLQQLRHRMDEVGPLLAYHKSPDLLGRSFEDDLLAELPPSRFRTFTDHDNFCQHLHKWITERYAISIEAELCATSREVGRATDYAKYIDILTHQPLRGYL